ncbi:glycosyl hydrolase family 95 catalytic domain-containing protein [Jidongwangia harbinensis]|uniref:glycosyl hydrolase family 95 catalytic domain-containing protein n=1 Tax=Jidongwangia harbinensis TaxID=2878561 RepID=UPI001CD974DF|nr:glycoside hydrolase N-terminal domain-containing protein [Jidongwangia harbinensis]MCA2213131.1 glycoside hydrolase family 95 protein [Jidongwangia harbinensis]
MPEGVNDGWEDAMAAGNGRQGALCWGTPDELRVTVSHERLFLPLGPPLDPPDTAHLLPRVRDLLTAGRYADAATAVHAAAVAAEPAYAETVWIDPLIGAATLRIRPRRRGPARDFRRSVDVASGLVTLAWRDDGGEVRLDAFVSRPADAVVVRLSAGGGFTGTLRLMPVDGTPPRPFSHTVVAGPDRLTLRGRFDGATWPGALTGYRVDCRVTPPATASTGDLALHGDTVLVLRTTPGAGPAGPAPDASFGAMLAAHAAVHGELFRRVRLDLGADPMDRERPAADLPFGPALVERLFDAGRHLIISSSGDLPPTLQGVWSGTWTPPWSSGYTLDGNLPAAVAALLPTGTPELLLPLFDLVDRVRDDLRRNARRLYGARGLLTPVHLSTHGRQNHFGPVWCQTFWTAGAGWLARLYVDYWRYTGDRAFLRDRAWPFLYAAAEFLLDVVPVRDGTAVFAPSYSPENAPATTGSQATVNATMDVAVARDLLGNVLAVAAELDRTPPPGTRALLDALPGYRIADGRLAEWIHPDLGDQPAHRHASHLWPLWYEPDPLITGDPAVRAAAVAAIRDRLAWWAGSASDEMGYGLAQLGLAAAALGLAEEAWATVRVMATRYWGANLVPRHNRNAIFNVDLAGGFPAVVTAMLVRSAHGRLDLLPARPDAWPRGRVTGLAARDAVTVAELWWEPGAAGVTLTAARDVRVTVGAPPGMAFDGAASREVPLTNGTALTLSCVSIKNIPS